MKWLKAAKRDCLTKGSVLKLCKVFEINCWKVAESRLKTDAGLAFREVWHQVRFAALALHNSRAAKVAIDKVAMLVGRPTRHGSVSRRTFGV